MTTEKNEALYTKYFKGYVKDNGVWYTPPAKEALFALLDELTERYENLTQNAFHAGEKSARKEIEEGLRGLQTRNAGQYYYISEVKKLIKGDL